MAVSTNPNGQEEYKDQNVMSFMMQLVQEKFGDDVEIETLNQEADRLYGKFGNDLVGHFEPMLSEDQKREFDKLVSVNNDQEALLSYLVEAIPDLEQQILQILVSFRTDYLQAK